MENKKILVFTRSAWRDDLNTGITLTNLFSNYKGEILNFYLKDQEPLNNIVARSYSLSEKKILGIKSKINNSKNISGVSIKSDLLKFIVDIFWILFFNRRNKVLKLIKEEKPSVIFMPMSEWLYPLFILKILKKELNMPKVILFHTDDNLSDYYKPKGVVSKIYRRILKYYLIKFINQADINYCISEKQKEVYSAILRHKIEFKLLHRGVNYINENTIIENNLSKSLKMAYSGNLQYGRDKTMINLFKKINEYNNNNIKKIYIDIYSYDIENIELNELIVKSEYFNFKGFVFYEKLLKKLENYDYVLHLESLEDKFKYQTALSFSTKIVDYMKINKPIIAIGWDESASIHFIKKNQIGIILNHLFNYSSLYDINTYNNYCNNINLLLKDTFNLNKIQAYLYSDLTTHERKNL